MTGPLGRAMCGGDFAWAAGYISGRFDVVVTADQIHKWMKKHKADNGWSDCTWSMWLKNRIGEIEPPGCNYTHTEFFCELNVFFPFLEETDEMLARLGNENHVKAKSKTARSRIGKTLLSELEPINCVAGRVMPKLEDYVN